MQAPLLELDRDAREIGGRRLRWPGLDEAARGDEERDESEADGTGDGHEPEATIGRRRTRKSPRLGRPSGGWRTMARSQSPWRRAGRGVSCPASGPSPPP